MTLSHPAAWKSQNTRRSPFSEGRTSPQTPAQVNRGALHGNHRRSSRLGSSSPLAADIETAEAGSGVDPELWKARMSQGQETRQVKRQLQSKIRQLWSIDSLRAMLA